MNQIWCQANLYAANPPAKNSCPANPAVQKMNSDADIDWDEIGVEDNVDVSLVGDYEGNCEG